MTTDTGLITTEEAAKILGCAANTLQVDRFRGRWGVPFIRVGRCIRYDRQAVQRWAAERACVPEPREKTKTTGPQDATAPAPVRKRGRPGKETKAAPETVKAMPKSRISRPPEDIASDIVDSMLARWNQEAASIAKKHTSDLERRCTEIVRRLNTSDVVWTIANLTKRVAALEQWMDEQTGSDGRVPIFGGNTASLKDAGVEMFNCRLGAIEDALRAKK